MDGGGDSISVARSPERSSRKDEAERRAVLEADPRAQEVTPSEVLCRKCQKWIKLSGVKYMLGNWQKHQNACGDAVYVFFFLFWLFVVDFWG